MCAWIIGLRPWTIFLRFYTLINGSYSCLHTDKESLFYSLYCLELILSASRWLEDSSERTSDPDPADFRYIPQDRNIFLEQVNPGVTQQGQVIFSVAADASGLTLILKDTNLLRSSQNQARVDLGI